MGCSAFDGIACTVSGSACMFVSPNSKLCATFYGEGPDVVVKGDKILIYKEGGSTKLAKCTGITHKNLIHFMYYTENGCPVAGTVGRGFVEKFNS